MANKKKGSRNMLKYDQKAKEVLDKSYGGRTTSVDYIEGVRQRVKQHVEKTKPIKPRIPEPQDDPKPKLYRIDWVNKDSEHKHRYVAAIDKVIAATLFEKKYAKGHDINNISINRVPSDWKIRFPVMWDRIGITIEETQQEAIAAAKQKEIEKAAAFKEWGKLWYSFWKTLSASQEDDINMWTELRRVKMREWLHSFMETWSDIGQTKWENKSSFDYLEID